MTARRLIRNTVLSAVGSFARPLQRNSVRFFYGHSAAATDAANFRKILRTLNNWYDLVSLPDAVALARSGDVSGRYLCLSFDDGFRDNYEVVAPILGEFGVAGCFFVTSNLVGGDETTKRRILVDRIHTSPDRLTLTWDMVRGLHREGSTIGCHTVDHVNLAEGPRNEAIAQVRQSRQHVEREIGAPCDYFAWPYGLEQHCPDEVLGAVASEFREVFSAMRSRDVVSYGGRVLNRDHFEPAWPVSHIRYFASRPVNSDGRRGANA
jgi:peptidoglycan/xylan/chitin deacetylase (PgdA/CDA1 family)